MSTPIGDLVEKLWSTGIPPEAIIAAVRAAEECVQALVVADPVTAKRRAYDRERKRKKVPENSVEIPAIKQAKKERSPTPPKEKLPTKDSERLSFDSLDSQSEVPRARGKKSACRLPEGWMPSLDDFDFARKTFPADRIQIEIDKFRDHFHARAGPNAVKRDWSATWRNWCRRAVEINGTNGNGQHREFGKSGAQQGARSAGRGHSALAAEWARKAAGSG